MDSMAFQSLTLLLLRRIEDVDDHAGLSVVSYLDCHIHLVPILPCRGQERTRRGGSVKKQVSNTPLPGPARPPLAHGPRAGSGCASKKSEALMGRCGCGG